MLEHVGTCWNMLEHVGTCWNDDLPELQTITGSITTAVVKVSTLNLTSCRRFQIRWKVMAPDNQGRSTAVILLSHARM